MGRKILSLLMAVMIIIPFAQVVSADNALECAVFFSTEDAEYSPYAEDSGMDNIEIRKNETGTFRIMWYDYEKMVSTQVLIDGQPVEVQEITTKRNEDPSILDTYVNFLITGEVGSEHKAKIIWELMRADDDSVKKTFEQEVTYKITGEVVTQEEYTRPPIVDDEEDAGNNAPEKNRKKPVVPIVIGALAVVGGVFATTIIIRKKK